MKNKLKVPAIKLLIVSVLLISVFVIFGCSKSSNTSTAPVKTPFAGKYTEKTQKDISLELVSNGTFTMIIRKQTIKGTYEAKGNDLTFYPGQGVAANATVKDSTITFDKVTTKVNKKDVTTQLIFDKQ